MTKSINFGKTLKQFRKFSGLSQEAFAHKLCVSFTTVNRWENGHVLPNQLARKNIENLWKEMGFTGDRTEQRPFKVLIVDDAPELIGMFRRSLEKLTVDLSIETAEDGYEAGLKVVTFRPDLVFLDIFMPGIRGDLVCQKIKRDPLTQDLYLVVMSGNFNDLLKDKLFEYGADCLLEKPLNWSQVNSIVSAQVNQFEMQI